MSHDQLRRNGIAGIQAQKFVPYIVCSNLLGLTNTVSILLLDPSLLIQSYRAYLNVQCVSKGSWRLVDLTVTFFIILLAQRGLFAFCFPHEGTRMQLQMSSICPRVARQKHSARNFTIFQFFWQLTTLV